MHPKRCTVCSGMLGVSYNLTCLGVGVCVGSCRIRVSCSVGSGVSVFAVGAQRKFYSDFNTVFVPLLLLAAGVGFPAACF